MPRVTPDNTPSKQRYNWQATISWWGVSDCCKRQGRAREYDARATLLKVVKFGISHSPTRFPQRRTVRLDEQTENVSMQKPLGAAGWNTIFKTN